MAAMAAMAPKQTLRNLHRVSENHVHPNEMEQVAAKCDGGVEFGIEPKIALCSQSQFGNQGDVLLLLRKRLAGIV